MKFLHDFAYKTQEDQSQSQVCVGPFLTSVKKKKKNRQKYILEQRKLSGFEQKAEQK